MNIFALSTNPWVAATMHCDKHVPKMVIEIFQQLGSAVRRHGATDSMMPLTQKGTPLRGGYHNHPCTRWTGDCRGNYLYAQIMGTALCREFEMRFGKKHASEFGIKQLGLPMFTELLPPGKRTPFAQAMPDEYKSDDGVEAYRRYYIEDKARNIVFEYNRGREMPQWLREGIQMSSEYCC
jgi:hypothetical protein